MHQFCAVGGRKNAFIHETAGIGTEPIDDLTLVSARA